jgi:periplasmic protein CpxP/Spy
MKSVKLFISVLALGVLTSLPVLQAQDTPPPAAGGGGGGGGARGGRGGRGGMMTVDTIEKAVGTLTADQKTKITAILAKLQTDMQGVAQEDRRTKGMELRTAAMKEIRALLTADQQTKFDAIPQGGGRRGGGGGGGGTPPAGGGGGN